MRYVAGTPDTPANLELTERNLLTLLEKLKDPDSARTLTKQEEKDTGNQWIQVTAVPDSEHYSERAPGDVYLKT